MTKTSEHNYNNITELQQWATFQVERGLEKVEFYTVKSTASYRLQAAQNWQRHVDRFAKLLETLEAYESLVSYNHEGDPNLAFACLVAYWQMEDYPAEHLQIVFEDALRLRQNRISEAAAATEGHTESTAPQPERE